MGISIPCWHGRSAAVVERHGRHLSCPSSIGTFGAGFYLAADQKAAQSYADEGSGIVLAFDVAFTNPYTHRVASGVEDEFGELFGTALVNEIFDSDEAKRLLDCACRAIEKATDGRWGYGSEIPNRLRELGYDGLVVEYEGGSKEIIVFPGDDQKLKPQAPARRPRGPRP